MSKEKTYVGNGKEVAGYDLINVSVCVSDIPNDSIFQAKNGKKYINISVGRRREVNEYGHTHSVWLNDYKPEAKQESKPSKAYKVLEDDPMPF